MKKFAQHLSSATLCLLTILLISSCNNPSPANIEHRLWLSKIPQHGREAIAAVVIVKSTKGRYFGSFLTGSLFQGAYELFEWKPTASQEAQIRFLQTEKRSTVHIDTCEPDRGFDDCILLSGISQKPQRYQSRKHWGLPRKHGNPSTDMFLQINELIAQGEVQGESF